MSRRTPEFSEKDLVVNLLQGVKNRIKPKNVNQKKYWKLMDNSEIVLCSGPAGCGKSLLALAKAIRLLKRQDTKYHQLYLITPAVNAEEDLGYLPGDLQEKLDPFLDSSFYLLKQLIGRDVLQRLRHEEIIKPLSFAHLRGRNVDNAVLILEEAQNCSIQQMKTLLTRIGHHTKYFISGDTGQSDTYDNKESQGLHYAMNKLSGMDEVGTFEFTDDDIMRNPIIGKILSRFD